MSHAIYPHLMNIAMPFPALLLDAYGVFWNGSVVFPDALEVMQELISKGKVVGILSNTSQLAVNEARRYQAHGIIQGKHYHFVMTSGEVSKQVFCHEQLPFPTPKKKYWVFDGTDPKFAQVHRAIFQETLFSECAQPQEADFIFASMPRMNGEEQVEAEVFLDELQKIARFKLPMICTCPDRYGQVGIPPKRIVQQGSIAALYEALGRQVLYFGKPYPKAYSMAMEQFQKYRSTQTTEVLMVGDTPETDIRGARLFGMPSALIICNGALSPYRLQDIVDCLCLSDRPDFFIETL